MQKVNRNNQKILYFTDKVRASFNTFLEYPCTVVEAPMGYGKTTAVAEALDFIDANVIWQKVYDNSTGEFWEGFCQAISKTDKECAQGLKSIGMLEDSLMRHELMRLLDKMSVSATTFIVIDDYHYIKSKVADEFLRLLILNMPENLHLVIVTRIAFLSNSRELILKGVINHIGTKTLAFTQSDIKSYYRLLGIHLEQDEVEQLYAYSEGWVSALYMVAMDYKIHGCFVFTRNVPELAYEAVYEPLDGELKDFLMCICQFDMFTLEQAQYVWGKDNVKKLLDSLFEGNAFISQDRITGNYSLHNIFSMCVREQFQLLPEESQQAVWRRLGEVHLKEKQYFNAMKCYYNAKHFEGVLEAMEDGDIILSIQNEHKDLLIQCYHACPPDLKIRHPRSSLFFGTYFITQFMDLELFDEACKDFHYSMEVNNTLTKDQCDQLLGEYELLQMLAHYNDLIKMTECSERASKLLKTPAKFYDKKNSFLLGSPSTLYLYYRASGELADLIEFIRNSTFYYTKNNSGHGYGFRPLLEAEWLYSIGDFENAEIITHKSITIAKENGQGDLELAGMFLLVKLALYRGDYFRMIKLLGQMEDMVRYEVKHYQTYWLIYTLDLCTAEIYTCLEQIDKIPNWIFEYEYPKYIQFPSIAYANMIYGRALLLKGSNTQLLGLCEQFGKLASFFPNVLAVITTDIYAAIANYRLSRIEDFHVAMKHALDTAMPDDLIMPFVENAKSLLPILDALSCESKYTAFIRKIREVYAGYSQSVQKIINENFTAQTTPLTEREKQIALLAADGLNNKEIAGELYISPNTVKLELKNIFRKLDINSRVLLKKEMI